jgi:restriction endonuclease S subunit
MSTQQKQARILVIDDTVINLTLMEGRATGCCTAYVTGAAQPKLSMGNLRNIEVTVPDYNTQARLGQILGDISELAASLQKQTSLLEKAARLIYTEWFVRLRPARSSTSISTNW